MMIRKTTLVLTGLLLTVGMGTGCNIFDFAFDQGGDVATLVDDARHHRANGNYDKAIDLLQQALAIDPSNAEVRFELASTLMRRDGLDLFTLEQLTSHLLGAGGAPLAGRGAAADSCTFEPGASVEPFDPRDFDSYQQILDARETLLWVIELLNDPDAPGEAPAMPEAFTSLNICNVLGPDGLDYDRDSVLNALYAQFGDDDDLVVGALTVNAIALTLLSYIELFEQPDLNVDWFIVDDTTVGACIASEHYDLFISRAQGEVQRAGQALISLDLLVYHTGNTQFAEIVADAADLYDLLQSEPMNPCTR